MSLLLGSYAPPQQTRSADPKANQSVATPTGHQFSPYDSNGGSILAIAGQDFCVVAGDTRQSTGYNIQTRYKPKVFRLNDKASLACNGFSADAEALVNRVKQQMILYRYNHGGAEMSLGAIARMISNMLYGKRFFPYYVYNILGGIDEDGKGAVYSFDPVGSYERETCRAAGAAQSLLQPFLDNQIMYKNQHSTQNRKIPEPGTYDLATVLRITYDSFTSATERHIEVGDGLEMFLVRRAPQPAGAGAGGAPGSSDAPKVSATTAARADAPAAEAGAGGASATSTLDLHALFGAVEAVGGVDEQTPGATMVVRKELKKD
ncbi:unnamed protein product [Jaminaea pallidilutea]